MRSDDIHPRSTSSSKRRNRVVRLAVASLLVSGSVVLSVTAPAFAQKPGDLSSMPNPGGLAGETSPLTQMTDLAKDLLRDQLFRIVSPPKPASPVKTVSPAKRHK